MKKEKRKTSLQDDDSIRRRRVPVGEVTDKYHYKADVKLVYWIPYHANTFPVPTRFLPGNWETQKISQEFRIALRFMLSTGNPTPPDGFPNRAAWDSFMASKEYRGLLWTRMSVCCPGADPKTQETVLHNSGYTPPPSNIRKGANESAEDFNKRLNEEHKDNQNVGSIVEGLASGSGTGGQGMDSVYGFPWIQQWGAPDTVDDAVEKLRDLHKGKDRPPHSFSEGEEIFNHEPRTESNCVLGKWTHYLRVGKTHNLLNYILTGKIIPFQGGSMAQRVCCDGKLTIYQKYTGIPSLRLYVNNVKVWEYDMLSAPFDRINEAFNPPGMKTDLGALDKQEAPPDNPNVFNLYTQSLRKLDGCPDKPFPPDEWPYDAV
ncbi:MAG: hypothetical protein EPN55_04270 [Gammaproteobacteria bacterium]|nr:MAG: hypothetical protein EPN55_04270 [Gammaproteobacteria bacterium]